MGALHSPAPWSLDEDGDIINKQGIVAVLYALEDQDHGADGQLIAAAPELLSSLEQMVCAFGHAGGSAVDQAVAALAKAKVEA